LIKKENGKIETDDGAQDMESEYDQREDAVFSFNLESIEFVSVLSLIKRRKKVILLSALNHPSDIYKYTVDEGVQ
jgi:hypothetical protein